MDTVIPHLYASAPEALSFAPSLEIRSYLLERDSGNLLLYRPDTLERDVEGVTELGGVSRQYLNHRHEASPISDWVAATFGAPLFVHEADAPSVSKNAHVAETFSERHRLDGDFEVIPIPGHTPGATAYLWDSGGHRILFSGDTIYLRRGRVGRRGARLQRPRALHGEPRAARRPRLRRPRSVGRDGRRALLRGRR